MKSKPSSKNSAKCGPLFSLLVFILFLNGCSGKIEPTYKEKEIPYYVKKLCKDEYNLNVTTQRRGATLWIYAPLSKILHKEFGMKEDKVFDEEITDKLRNILNTVGRVLISSDNTPNFFVLVASDINIGLDYTMLAYVEDIKKSYAGFIPWTEANRRYVIKFNIEPQALADRTGRHLKPYDIKLPDFLAEQITQRIAAQFQDEHKRRYFKVEKSAAAFNNGVFTFEYSINRISKPDKETNIEEEILNLIAYCLKSYDFKDFSGLELIDLVNQTKTVLSAAAVLARPIE